ncbi:MAG: hypothetical protein KGM49_00255 [Sphingomonadales bacterium]|nr:hypothetical protein [Sphingomonadales bacterium]
MSAPQSHGRRGQPVIALVLVLVSWVGVRVMIRSSEQTASPQIDHSPRMAARASAAPLMRVPEASHVSAASASPEQGMAAGSRPDRETLHTRRPVPVAPSVWPERTTSPGPAQPVDSALPLVRPLAVSPRISGGHQMLWLAALAQLPMPDLARIGPSQRLAPPRQTGSQPGHWSADAWLVLRRGGNGFNLPGAGLPSGVYGASQAGAVIRYRLAPSSANRPTLYLRTTSGLQMPRGEELAAGFAARPLARVPVSAMAEVRATRTMTGIVVRPSVALVSEFPPLDLPLGLRGDVYVQGGYVGGRDATAFADGQARLEHRIAGAGRWELRAGAGTWGGAQKGAKRIDVGPTATLGLPLGGANGRVSADWRFRIVGNAAPTSGPAITLSAGF